MAFSRIALGGLVALLPGFCMAATVSVVNDLPSIGIAGVVANAVVGGAPAVVNKSLDAKPIITSESATNGTPTMAAGEMLPTTNFSEQVVASPGTDGLVHVTIKYAVTYSTSLPATSGGQTIDLPGSETYTGQSVQNISPGAFKVVDISLPDGPKLHMALTASH